MTVLTPSGSAAAPRPDLLVSSALHLMTHYVEQASPDASRVKLARTIERHLEALAVHGELTPVLRATCQQLSAQWAALVARATPEPPRKKLIHALAGAVRARAAFALQFVPAFAFTTGLSNMTLFKLAVSAAFSFSLLAAAPARAAEDPAHYLLSPALIDKLKAAESDMKAQHLPDEAVAAPAPDAGGNRIDAAIAGIDRDAKTLAVLARHGLTSRDLVLSAHALLHAGMYVASEKTRNKTGNKTRTADPYTSYTTEQKANIAVVRAFAAGRRK